MNFDRNTIIGFSLLAVLFFFYFYYNSQQQATYQKEQARKDSIQNALKPRPDTAAMRVDSLSAESARQLAQAGIFANATNGTEELIYAENELFKIAFTNKGGQPKYVELKNFKNAVDSKLVKLAASDFNRISYAINTSATQSAQSADLFFSNGTVKDGPLGSKIVSFELTGGDSAAASAITHQFIIYPKNYQVDFNISLNQSNLLSGGNMNLIWQYEAHQQEKDLEFEQQNTQVGYMEDGEFDYHTIGRKSSVELDKNIAWVGVRQRFFNTFLSVNGNFANGKIEWTIPDAQKHVVVQSIANMQVKATPGTSVPLKIFYGPADYNILKGYDNGFAKLVNLGQGMYAFVRPINQYVILPIFDFFKGFNIGYGIIIAILTLIIRLITSPLVYKSYLSGAKMKALRPEIALLREKHGQDQQAMSMEQMKLFREAGVNPLGGCVPALLQIPIFFALYAFFSSTVDLRGVDFLWANDLSAFDDPIKFGFNIPLLGSHLSLFTLLATVTSLLISVYSMSMSPDQSNPMMKYMPYIFPVFLLFIFNKMPSALTWYYTVSNVITLILQFIIQNYIIDHEKILAKIQANRKKPKTKSKWQQRLEQMQEQQKQLNEKQSKTKR